MTRHNIEGGGDVTRVHTFKTTGSAYNASQTHDEIHDGDVLHVPSENAIAIMVSAWPTALTPEHAGEAFHELADDVTWDSVPNLDGGRDDYRASADLARRTLAAREAADTSTTFHDPLVVWERVRYTTTGPWGTATGSGVYLGVALDEEDRVPYHYFADGEVNGLSQGSHGFPAAPGTPLTTELTPTALIRGWERVVWLHDGDVHEVQTNEDGDELCPKCGHDDVATWADDGESDEADWWGCETFSGGCGATGAVVEVKS